MCGSVHTRGGKLFVYLALTFWASLDDYEAFHITLKVKILLLLK